MSRITMRVPHAAPYVREALCWAACEWQTASKPTTKRQAYERATALLQALRILMAADDVPPVPGIANRHQLPVGAVRAALKLAQGDGHEILGLADDDDGS